MRGQLVRCIFALSACAAVVQAQMQQVLFLADGTRMAVREYKVVQDRLRYFSSERGQWEEVPVAIVDFERTRDYNRALAAEFEASREEERRERAAERRARTELHSVPLDDGVYYLRGQDPVPVEQVFYEVDRSTKRSFLNIIAPVPVIAGKRTVFVKGLSATTVTTDQKPAFYIRLDRFARFGIARIQPERKKGRRIVQQVYTVPQSDEQHEVQDEVEIFRQQLAPLVYKVWPLEPLADGEYAIVNFTPGESDLRVWAFSHRPAGRAGPQ